MVNLTEHDLLELLGYAATGRHPLEVLGYGYSTRGAQELRRERPDLVPQACRLIRASLEEAGTFPRQPGEEVVKEGLYLERRPGGVVALHMSVEVGTARTARARVDFATAEGAILELLRRLGDPAYLPVPPR
jgi:hypothetical protein